MADGVLFFLGLNDRGGAEISMLRLAKGLRERGTKVTLVIYGSLPQLAAEYGLSDCTIDLDQKRTLLAAVGLFLHLREKTYDAVFSALTHTNVAAFVALWAARSSARLIATEHGLDGLRLVEQSRLFFHLVSFAYRHAFAVVAVSQRLAEKWRVFLGSSSRVTTLYNPAVDPEEMTGLPAAHEWLADKTEPVVMALGRLRPEKGFLFLLRAFARVVKERPARLVILGEGGQRRALEKAVRDLGLEDRVLLPGFRRDVAAWLPYADLFVCSSVREGFGNALVEAMAFGVPVVSTDCPYGPAEILQEGKFGKLTPIDDEAAMAQAIVESLTFSPDREKVRARAEVFSLARCIDAYLALLDKGPLSSAT